MLKKLFLFVAIFSNKITSADGKLSEGLKAKIKFMNTNAWADGEGEGYIVRNGKFSKEYEIATDITNDSGIEVDLVLECLDTSPDSKNFGNICDMTSNSTDELLGLKIVAMKFLGLDNTACPITKGSYSVNSAALNDPKIIDLIASKCDNDEMKDDENFLTINIVDNNKPGLVIVTEIKVS